VISKKINKAPSYSKKYMMHQSELKLASDGVSKNIVISIDKILNS